MGGLLVSQQIREQIVNGVIESADLDKCVAPASYQLRVGSYRESQKGTTELLPPGEGAVVQPGGLLLVGCYERVHFPKNLIGLLYLRSSYARRGLLPWSQGIVEPGYSGSITIVIHNSSSSYIPIVGGERICHLMFSIADQDTEIPYGESYQGSEGATESKEVPAWKTTARDLISGVTEGATTSVIKFISGS
jgi:deoxycytidine triphosphate deaminase